MYNKILLPTDGSENAARAGEHAIWIAEASGADILILYMVEPYYPQISALPHFSEELYDEVREEGKNIVESLKKELELIQNNRAGRRLKLTTKIKEGRAYLEIIKSIKDENIDLIVLGASGRHGLDLLMLGSVSERVIREASCPVLVVH